MVSAHLQAADEDEFSSRASQRKTGVWREPFAANGHAHKRDNRASGVLVPDKIRKSIQARVRSHSGDLSFRATSLLPNKPENPRADRSGHRRESTAAVSCLIRKGKLRRAN